MKLLLDECLPQPLRIHIVGHEVSTVGYMQWAGISNGRLLKLAAANGFDALITADRSLQYQQDPLNLPLALIVLIAKSTDLSDLLLLVPLLLNSLPTLPPNAVTRISIS